MPITALKAHKSSYLFKDKDLVIDVVRTAVQDSGLSYQKIWELGGPSPSTQYNWFHGGTKRPQFCTVEATFRTLGYTLLKPTTWHPPRRGRNGHGKNGHRKNGAKR